MWQGCSGYWRSPLFHPSYFEAHFLAFRSTKRSGILLSSFCNLFNLVSRKAVVILCTFLYTIIYTQIENYVCMCSKSIPGVRPSCTFITRELTLTHPQRLHSIITYDTLPLFYNPRLRTSEMNADSGLWYSKEETEFQYLCSSWTPLVKYYAYKKENISKISISINIRLLKSFIII